MHSADPLLFIIHAPTFMEEYNQFWRNPSRTPVMWIALLYSAMALGIICGPRNPGMNEDAGAPDASNGPHDYMSNLVTRFLELASSAMVLADIAKSQPYTLETLMIYSECEFLRRDDHHTKIWLMNGVSLRVAMRMGYHRDPSNFKGMSPFQGEMRRRVWHVINMMDTLISFTVGLPAVVRRVENDVRPPRNLMDSDIFPGMKKMPKERNSSEITAATYNIAKSRVCAVFAEAAELAQKITPPKYATVVALEKRLEEAHNMVPEGMRVRPLELCMNDAPVLIMGRYNIELLYMKTKLVLHRTYFTAGQTDPRYADSRRICIETAREILNYHRIIFEACQPGGQLNKVWWYMSSLQTYDFLLAAMVLCLELNHLKSVGNSSEKITEMIASLQGTYDIWANHPNRYRDSIRGAEILKAMLNKWSSPITPSRSFHNSISSGYGGSKLGVYRDRLLRLTNVSDGLILPKELTPESQAESQPDEFPPNIWGPWPAENMPFDTPDIPPEIDWVCAFTIFPQTCR